MLSSGSGHKMAYSVQHVRFTLECDACGRVEKRDLDAAQEGSGVSGWSSVETHKRHAFCCPDCYARVLAVLLQRELAEAAAKAALEASCEHDFQPRGLLSACAKCGRWMR